MGTDTVQIAGHTEKKTTVYMFAGAGVLVVGYALYSSKKKAAAAAAASTTGGAFTDPSGSVCAAPNPATGYCPGTPADVAAQQQLAAGSQAYGTSSGLAPAGSTLGGQSLSNAVPVFTNNGAWGQYVETMLGSNGSDAIAAAIANYLAGSSLSSDQATVVDGNLISARTPADLGPWMKALLAALEKTGN